MDEFADSTDFLIMVFRYKRRRSIRECIQCGFEILIKHFDTKKIKFSAFENEIRDYWIGIGIGSC